MEQDKHFYSNDSGINYYSCTLHNDIPNCDECSNGNTCDKCKTDYALKHSDTVQCELKSSLEEDKHFYTNDSGINYYSCLLNNDIPNCDECTNGNTCDKCETGYEFNNIKTLCIKKSDKEEHLYETTNGGIFESSENDIFSFDKMTSNPTFPSKSTNNIFDDGLKTTYLTDKIYDFETTLIKESSESLIKSSNIFKDAESLPSTSIIEYKKDIPTSSLIENTSEMPSTEFIEDKQTTYNSESTFFEEENTKTNSLSEKIIQETTSNMKEIKAKTSNLETSQITYPKMDITEAATSNEYLDSSSNSKVETTEVNNFDIQTTEYTTSTKESNFESGNTNNFITESTTSKEDIFNPTTSDIYTNKFSSYKEKIHKQTTNEYNNLESTYSKLGTTEITNTFNIYSTLPSTLGAIDNLMTTSKKDNIEPSISEADNIESNSLIKELKETTMLNELKQYTTQNELEKTTFYSELKEPTTNDRIREQTTSQNEINQGTTQNKLIETTTLNEFKETTNNNEINESTTLNEFKELTTNNEIKEFTTNNEIIEPTSYNKLKETTTQNDFKELTTYNKIKEQTTTQKEFKDSTSQKELEESSSSELMKTTTKNEIGETTSQNEIGETTTKNEIGEKTSQNEIGETTTKNKIEETTTQTEIKQQTTQKEIKEITTQNEIKEQTIQDKLKESTSFNELKEETTQNRLKEETTENELKEETIYEPNTSEKEKEETNNNSKIDTSEYFTASPTISKTTFHIISSSISENKEKTSIINTTGNITPTTSSIKESEKNTEKTTFTPTTNQIKYITNTEKTITSTYNDIKENITNTSINDNPIISTLINNTKTEMIIIKTTIPNIISLTSIASTNNGIKTPTSIIEYNPNTTMIIDYGSASCILVGFSNFFKYITYCSFYIHFVSIRGYIFSPTLIFNVELAYKSSLRILQNPIAKCEKADDDMVSAAYLCNVEVDTSNIESIKVMPKFEFESQNVTVIGTSPVALTLMENIIEAEGEYNTLLESVIYVLDHSTIYKNNKNNIFNITGIINDPKPNFGKIDLELRINIENQKNKTEESVNCKIIDIKISNYTLYCVGKNDILYNLQSAISIIDNDILVINFDANVNSEIIFSSSNSKRIITRKNDSKGLSAGIIAIIPVVIIIALISLIFLSKRVKSKNDKTFESAIVELKESGKEY